LGVVLLARQPVNAGVGWQIVGFIALSFLGQPLPLDFEEIFDRINQIDRTKIFKIWFKSGFNKRIRMIPMNKD
jgi:hypothetical protein